MPADSQKIILILHDEHYIALKSLSAYFSVDYYCVECEAKYNDKKKVCL